MEMFVLGSTRHFLIGCADFPGRGMKMCTCLKSPCMPMQWTARIVFYPYLEDKSFALVVGEGLVENEVGAFLFPLFLPLCVCVCERELLWWTKGRKNSDFPPQNCNLIPPDTAYFLRYIYTFVYIFIWNIYMCAVTHMHTHKATLEKWVYDSLLCKATVF